MLVNSVLRGTPETEPCLQGSVHVQLLVSPRCSEKGTLQVSSLLLPGSHRMNLFALRGSSGGTQDQTQIKGQPLSTVPKPDQIDEPRGSCLPLPLLWDLPDDWRIPASNPLPCSHHCTDSQVPVKPPFSVHCCLLSHFESGERIFPLHLSHTTGLLWTPLPPPHKLQGRQRLLSPHDPQLQIPEMHVGYAYRQTSM